LTVALDTNIFGWLSRKEAAGSAKRMFHKNGWRVLQSENSLMEILITSADPSERIGKLRTLLRLAEVPRVASQLVV
jgi:hypothetical protein